MFKKYDKIKQLGSEENKDIFSDTNDEIVIQEKIDGGNFRFYFTEKGDIIFGSRTQELDGTKEGEIAKCFKRVIDYVRYQIMTEFTKEELSDLSGLIFFGEACFKHTITYDFDKMPSFLGFDVYDIEKERYLSYEDCLVYFQMLNLETAPLVKMCKASEITQIDDSIVPKQKYALASAPDQQAEGVVFKNYSKQIFAKHVRNKFKEKNAEAFGGNPKYNKIDDTNNADFIFRYCTNMRIEKVVLKLVDTGKSMEMDLMGDVIRNTYNDIIEEEWREILTESWKLDLKQIRKNIAPRCRAVLQSMITNNALSKGDDE